MANDSQSSNSSDQQRKETVEQLRRERFGDSRSLERERPKRPSDRQNPRST